MLKVSTRLMFTAGLTSLLAAGCGDDGGMMNGDDTVDPPDAEPTETCPDHPNVTRMGEVCAISGGDTSPITEDLTLTADNEYLLDGPVWIGNDTDETVLTVEAGVTIYGGDGSFLLIQRGSKLNVNGTAAAPVVMTSAKAAGERGPSDWGGLVINGRAPINNGDASGEAPGEAGTGTYGGTMAADDSGTIRYLRVEFAGNKIDTENELNGIAFQGVGSGTTVEYVQTHMTSDDGVEFFGGSVNVKYLVVTGSDDDSMDWTGGWVGNVQFGVLQQLPGSGIEAERGIEADNLEANNSATPYSDPTLSNLTFISRDGNTADGVKLRRGTRAELHNSIITGFGGECIDVDDAQTIANVADDSLVVSRLVLDCTAGAADADGAALIPGSNSVEMDPMLDGWQPQDGSPALGIGAGPSGAFFDTVDYAGAMDATTDWTTGWTTDVAN